MTIKILKKGTLSKGAMCVGNIEVVYKVRCGYCGSLFECQQSDANRHYPEERDYLIVDCPVCDKRCYLGLR